MRWNGKSLNVLNFILRLMTGEHPNQLYHLVTVVCAVQTGLHAVHGSEGVVTVDSVQIADGHCREVNLTRKTL